MIDDLIKIEITDVEELIKFVQEKAIRQDWADVYKNDAKLLNLNYFKYILSFLKQMKAENDDIFKWVQEVTEDFYNNDFKANIEGIIKRQRKLKYKVEKPEKEKEKKPAVEEEESEEEDDDDIDIDDFNFNKMDQRRYGNDVHNGIYDLVDLDDQNHFGIAPKKEFITVKPVVVPVGNIKPDNVEVNPVVEAKPNPEPEEELDPHKKYTLDELKEKIKKDELKETLVIKQKFNPEEAKMLEERIKNIDGSLLEPDENLENKFNKTVKMEEVLDDQKLDKSLKKVVKKYKNEKNEENKEPDQDKKEKKEEEAKEEKNEAEPAKDAKGADKGKEVKAEEGEVKDGKKVKKCVIF